MKINLLYDFPQYGMILDLVREKLIDRGHEVICSTERFKPDLSCDCSLATMGNPFTHGSRPRFYIEHGCSIFKRQLFDIPIDCFLAYSEDWAEHVKRDMDELYGHRFDIVIVGYPRADVLLSKAGWKEPTRQGIRDAYKLDDRPIVSYFPSYKKDYDWRRVYARDVSISEVYNWLADDYNIFVAPHFMESYEEKLDVPSGRIIPYDGQSRIDFIVASDCVVSDNSGVTFEACGADVPLVVIGKKDDPNYLRIRTSRNDPIDHEEYFEDSPMCYGEELDKLSKVVSSAISSHGTIDYFKAKKRWWAERAMGLLDGHSTERVVDAIECYMRGK